MEMCSQLHTPVTLPPVQLNWQLGRTHSQSACLEKENNFLPLVQIEPQPIEPIA